MGSDIKNFYKERDMYFHRNVTDLAKSQEFYIEILGLELIAENPAHKWCNLSLPVKGITLSLTEDQTKANKEPSVDGLEISVDDLVMVRKILENKGANMSDIIDLPGILSMFDVHDPDNNLVTFVGSPRIESRPS